MNIKTGKTWKWLQTTLLTLIRWSTSVTVSSQYRTPSAECLFFFFCCLFSLYKTMSSENFMIHGYSCLTSFVYLSIINVNNILYPWNIFTILFPLTLGMSKLNIVIVKHNSGKYPPTIMCVGGGDQMNQVEHLSPR